MNEHLRIGPHGLRLLTDYEKGPDDGSVPLSENGAALSPYVCPGGELTIGYGCTKWFDGEDVEIHHRLSGEEQALELLDYQLDPYEAAVKRLVTRPMTQNQYAAFVGLCFNIGEGNFATCEALREFNEGRVENAAAAFGNWTGATCDRPPKRWPKGCNPADYETKMARDHKGSWRWVGPEGQYCRYMLRYVGLLSRHDSEALLFMGKNWTRALRAGGVKLFLTPTHPDQARWNSVKGRWEDNVKAKTMFKDVLAFAYYDDLPAADSPAPADAYPPIPVPTVGLDVEIERPAIETAAVEIPDAQFEQDELILTKPAPPIATEAGAGPAPLPQPEARGPVPGVSKPEPKPSNSEAQVSASVEKPAAAPASPPVAPPVVTSPPKPPPVIAPKQIDIRSIPYGEVDPANGAKNMTDSRRVLGMVVVGAGSLVQILAAREVVSSSVGAIFFDMSRDPIVVALFCGAVFWVVGWLTRKRGTQIVAKGMAEATTVLK